MSQTVYLIRHAMPDLPLEERWCVGGRTDLPLGTLGCLQASLLPHMPQLQNVRKVYCSSLSRARETALPLSSAPVAVPGLEEQDMGVWDGLSFVEIMERFPELYAAREINPDLLPEGAESNEVLRARVRAAVLRCMEGVDGDIAIVSHKSAIASLTGHRASLAYASVTPLHYDGTDFHADAIALLPHPVLTDAVCLDLLRAAGAGPELIAHCFAVAEQAKRLCDEANEKGAGLDIHLVRRAALLHDLAKGQPHHAKLGAIWLRELGYPEEAALVRQHNEPDEPGLSEAALVFLADKTVRGAARVSIEDRFAATRGRCRTPEAIEAHSRRLAKALALKEELHLLCGTELIGSKAQEETYETDENRGGRRPHPLP